MTIDRPDPERIMQLINGYWATAILGAAVGCSLFTHLDAGADTAERLAEATGLSERGTQALLDGLVGFGLVDVRGGTYRNAADAATYLVDDREAYLGGLARLKFAAMGGLAELPEALRAGGPTRPAVEIADNPHWEQVVPAITAQSVPVARIVADLLGLARAGEISILDVGGGSGVYSAAWLALNPAARAVQLDWAPVNALARRLLTERGLADRFSTVDGDFHHADFGTAAYDVAVYSHIAHQEGPEENLALFAKIRGALKPGGALVVVDYVVDDDRGGPAFPLLFASEMLIKSKQGGTWRRADYEGWLAKAGFTQISFEPVLPPATAIIAR